MCAATLKRDLLCQGLISVFYSHTFKDKHFFVVVIFDVIFVFCLVFVCFFFLVIFCSRNKSFFFGLPDPLCTDCKQQAMMYEMTALENNMLLHGDATAPKNPMFFLQQIAKPNICSQIDQMAV